MCLLKLAGKLEKDITTIPREIIDDVNDIADIVKHTQTNIKKCGTDAIDRFEKSGRKLVDKMTTCVDNKINN